MKKESYECYGVNLSNVRNAWEKKIIKSMSQVLPEFPEFDYCSICIQDVYALSLNQLTPKYIQQGTILIKKEYTEADFHDIVENSIQKVITNPNHS